MNSLTDNRIYSARTSAIPESTCDKVSDPVIVYYANFIGMRYEYSFIYKFNPNSTINMMNMIVYLLSLTSACAENCRSISLDIK